MSRFRVAGLVTALAALCAFTVNRANAQDMNANSRIGSWSDLSGIGSVTPAEGLGVQDPTTGMVSTGTVTSSGNVTFDPYSIEVTANYVGAYSGPAYASLNNTSTTTAYQGSPNLVLFAYGDVDQIQGTAVSNAEMDYQQAALGSHWEVGDPSNDYPYSTSSTFDTTMTAQANHGGVIIQIPASTLFVWSGECDAHATGPQGGGTSGGGGC